MLSVKTVFDRALTLNKKYWSRVAFWGVVLGVPYLIVQSFASTPKGEHMTPLAFLLTLIAVVLALVLKFSFYRFTLGLARGTEPKRPFLSVSWWPLASLFLASILVGIGTVLGLILLIVPGIIFLVATCIYQIIVVDRNQGPIDAIKESMRLTKGSRMSIFYLGLIVIGINILGAIALVVGLLFTVPLSMFILVEVYRTLGGENALSTPVSPAPTTVPAAGI